MGCLRHLPHLLSHLLKEKKIRLLVVISGITHTNIQHRTLLIGSAPYGGITVIFILREERCWHMTFLLLSGNDNLGGKVLCCLFVFIEGKEDSEQALVPKYGLANRPCQICCSGHGHHSEKKLWAASSHVSYSDSWAQLSTLSFYFAGSVQPVL